MILYEEPLKIDLEDTKLIVDGTIHPSDVRLLKDMEPVLMGKAKIPHPQEAAYYMFRGVYAAEDLRYDITLIPPLRYDTEYAKTFGHYHPAAEKGLGFPEVYQVLQGNAAFILQKINRDESVSVRIVHAVPGQILLIPPGYGHVSVNTSEGDLVLANIVSTRFSSEYSQYKQNKGAAVYLTTEGTSRNSLYLIRGVEKIEADAINGRYGFICNDLLKEFYNLPSKFEFLNKPSLMFTAED